MRIGVDGFNLALARGTGVATYARSLISACSSLGYGIDLIYGLNVPATCPPEQRETLFFSALAEEGRSEGQPRRQSWIGMARARMISRGARDLVQVPASGRVIRKAMASFVPDSDRLFTFPGLFRVGERYLRRYGTLLPVRMPNPPPVMHWTYPVPVRIIGSRNVYTIHDLVPLRLPFLSLENKRYHEQLLRACIAESSHIMTVSETSRADILRYLPVGTDKVSNCYQALRDDGGYRWEPDEAGQILRNLFGLEPQGYFLFFGAIEPKKNVGRLLEAYLSSPLETPLVLAGPEGWSAGAELRFLDAPASQGGRTERVRRLGYLSADHLALLVASAKAVAFPSLYEGFGLPALEAMAAGVPVIAGAEGSLPEILDGAGLLVDPYDVRSIRAALIEMDGDADLREQLCEAGRERARAFTMERFSDSMAIFHRQLLGAGARNEGPHESHLPSRTSFTGETM
ncbi:MAG TPA: glycosyltransferase family 1 protein [Sphingobium sp.]|uniref:glycosyltransferase family 4 protein n=1 Tax=Sphingobium sp. TaxID=1912891 RepID=UPI002ED0A11D